MLSEGRIVEVGNHESLMRSEGYYHTLVIKQALVVVEDAHIEDAHIEDKVYQPNPYLRCSSKKCKKTLEQTNPEKAIEEESDLEVVKKILELNSPEYVLIIVGSVLAVLTGAAPPACFIVLGSVFGVRI